MLVENLVEILKELKVGFYAGVPDSRLKPLCNYLIKNYGVSSKRHIIAANEGNAVALAAGYYLATGKTPCVYLQNSGIGNIVNPVASLISNRVYGIPCVFIVGWRGEPQVQDEPQHKFQGEITIELLKTIGIKYVIIDKATTIEILSKQVKKLNALLELGNSIALIIKKNSLVYDEEMAYRNNNRMLREDVINYITAVSKEDIIVSTTGRTSRELFEIREKNLQPHKYDFLTVGSMGHSSSIALGIALNKPDKIVWCIDGDGAALMHMGSMAIIGTKGLKNYIHIIINNAAHESVGGQPTVAGNVDFNQIALGCGYKAVYNVTDFNELDLVLTKIRSKSGPILIEIHASIGSRNDLGRPTTTPIENKTLFMNYLRE